MTTPPQEPRQSPDGAVRSDRNPGGSDGVELVDWQLAACDAWEGGDVDGPYRGTIEVFTGGGKSLIALECLRRASAVSPGLRAVIVVPTLALARQWRGVLLTHTGMSEDQLGALDGDRKDDFTGHIVLIAVLNSAAEHLPALADSVDGPLMLIVDECHRAGAPKFSRVLSSKARFRLGLSATAEREDLDEDGLPIEYDDHVLGRRLGRIVYRFDLRAAREIGWLPEFTVHHHGVRLNDPERLKYEELTRRIDDLTDRLQDMGLDAGGARQASSKPGEVGQVARAYIGAVSLRKDLLYRASERSRIVEILMRDLSARMQRPRVLLFHERIDEAVELHRVLSSAGLGVAIGVEHSRLPESSRRASLDRFADGSAPVLVSVKALVEGIDVPDADIGISVASSASVRQRVQALGRVLRRRFDGTVKTAEMHVVYVSDTVDEAIYGKEDWSDLTGSAANHYWLWGLEALESISAHGPPRTPKPTEDQFLEQLGGRIPEELVAWTPQWPAQEWRLDGRGTVTDLQGRLVANPQETVAAVRRVKPTGGRFRVSTRHRLIVVPDPGHEEPRAWLVGRLEEPFVVASTDGATQVPGAQADAASDPAAALDAEEASAKTPVLPGDPYPGRTDRNGGTYRLRQKSGGVIERRSREGREFAETREGAGRGDLVFNARTLLEAWRETGEAGMTFHVNANGDAFYTSEGQVRFLAHVPGGFSWPTSSSS